MPNVSTPLRRLGYRLCLLIGALVPRPLLRLLHSRVPLFVDPADGFTVWLDADYARFVARDRARRS